MDIIDVVLSSSIVRATRLWRLERSDCAILSRVEQDARADYGLAKRTDGRKQLATARHGAPPAHCVDHQRAH
jgi:hypothetical protein